jgi:hypothetical protein
MARKESGAAKKFDLEVIGSAKELGEFQFGVLMSVSEKKYTEAINFLKKYQERKSHESVYRKKTEGIFKYAEELIHAIEAKKNFPNLTALAQAKQEEIHQKAMENWESLKVSMRRLKTIESDLAIADARSSIWVIKSLLFSFVVILSTWVINEICRSFGRSFGHIMDGLVHLIQDTFNNLF